MTEPDSILAGKVDETLTTLGVELFVVSAFRSFDRQLEIIKRKLTAGQTWEEIFRV